MDVTDQLAEILIRLTENRFVPSLQEMPDASMSTVIILAIAGQHAVHDPPDRVRLPFDQQVHVIRHQAIGIEEERKSLLLVCQ